MTQKVYVLPTRMKCVACKEVSKELFQALVEYGAGRCPHCGAVSVESDLQARIKQKPRCN